MPWLILRRREGGPCLLEHAQRIVEHVGYIAGVPVEMKDRGVLPRVLALYEPTVHQLS